ncbi:Hypothetical protein FKW44_006761, partial [Caligus rogercresseyi]
TLTRKATVAWLDILKLDSSSDSAEDEEELPESGAAKKRDILEASETRHQRID